MEIISYIFIIVSIIVSVVLHEFAHGYVSYKQGDPTPKIEGRLSLNPKYHINTIGLILMIGLLFAMAMGRGGMGVHTLGILFAIFFAKPVLVNPSYYKDPLKGRMLTSLAGPAMNFVLATVGILIIFFVSSLLMMDGQPLGSQFGGNMVIAFFYQFVMLNLILGTFNLIPVPPLDGFSILTYFFPQIGFFFKEHNHGFIFQFIFLLLLLGPLHGIVNVYVQSVAQGFFDILYGGLTRIFW